MMFSAPPEQQLEWLDSGVEGAYRFIKKLWNIVHWHVESMEIVKTHSDDAVSAEQKDLRRKLHETPSKVTDVMEHKLSFNTAIYSVMELINTYRKFQIRRATDRKITQEILEHVVIMLSLITHHITHVLWRVLGHEQSLITEACPHVDRLAMVPDIVTIAVQINGKLRAQDLVILNTSESIIRDGIFGLKEVKKYINEIISPNRLVNIVTN